MICNACGNLNAYRLRFSESGFCCDTCGAIGAASLPDVYFNGPYLDPHLIDVNKPEQAHGVYIESRRQKAEIMKRLGVHELGDKCHGSRPDDHFTQRREKEKGHAV